MVLRLAGTDETAVTAIVAHRTIAQRQRIKEAYKQSLGKVRAYQLSLLCSLCLHVKQLFHLVEH